MNTRSKRISRVRPHKTMSFKHSMKRMAIAILLAGALGGRIYAQFSPALIAVDNAVNTNASIYAADSGLFFLATGASPVPYEGPSINLQVLGGATPTNMVLIAS